MKPVIAIIGMGRSGTSLLCQILQSKGVFFGKSNDLIGKTPINIYGQQEHIEIQRIHNELLKDIFGITTWLFLIVGEEQKEWHKSGILKPYKDRLKDQILSLILNAKDSGSDAIAFKDARTTVLLPLWVDIFNELELEYNFVLCHRHPEEVYQSLIRCSEVYDVLPEEITPRKRIYDIWSQYLAHAYNYKDKIAIEVYFDKWFDLHNRYKQNLNMSIALDLPINELDLMDIIDNKERHF